MWPPGLRTRMTSVSPVAWDARDSLALVPWGQWFCIKKSSNYHWVIGYMYIPRNLCCLGVAICVLTLDE
jgi:hypothetical protein